MNYLDTNVVLRLLLGDIPKQKRLALQALEKSKCKISDLAIAEVVFVMEHYYKLERSDIKIAISTLSQVNNLTFNKELVFSALDNFLQFQNLSLEDCLLAAYASLDNSELLTFDKKLAKQIQTAKLIT